MDTCNTDTLTSLLITSLCKTGNIHQPHVVLLRIEGGGGHLMSTTIYCATCATCTNELQYCQSAKPTTPCYVCPLASQQVNMTIQQALVHSYWNLLLMLITGESEPARAMPGCLVKLHAGCERVSVVQPRLRQTPHVNGFTAC
jgi:hypothetical protein